MKSIARGIKAAAASFVEPYKGEEFVIAGKKLVCAHCNGTQFERKRYNLTTDLRQGLLADGATIYLCKKCQRIEWFYGLI